MVHVYESMIQNLLEKDFGSVDGWFSGEEISALRQALLTRYHNNGFRQAGIGNQFNCTRERDIRGDKIRWLSPETEVDAEKMFFNKLDGFVDYLNRTCYAGIRSHEFHYALYGPGTFYQKHVDTFNNDSRRKFSMVFYLNENWQQGHGGELLIYNEGIHKIEPVLGRIAFFTSDLEHEVLVTNVQRLSLTGWLKTS